MPVLSNTPLPGNTIDGSLSLGAQLGQAAQSSLLGSVGLNQASGRQNVADMFKYSNKTVGPTPRFIYPDSSIDWRVRISLAPNSTYFDPMNTPLLRPLLGGVGSDITAATAIGSLFGNGKKIGVVFPYTPAISITHTANYQAQKLTHSNYAQYFYDNSEVSSINITTEFTVQNVNEGQYLLAAIYFFRSITKMFFGQDPRAGNPPPLVYLNGYGQYYLPNIPCVVTSFQHTMPADCDYMDIPEPSVTGAGGQWYNPQFISKRLNSTRLPTTSSMTLSLQPVYSRTAQSQAFSLEDFARGALVNRLGGAGSTSAFGATQGATYANNKLKNGGFI